MQVSNKLCRICLTEDHSKKGMHPLFDETNKCNEILRRIEECGGIIVSLN